MKKLFLTLALVLAAQFAVAQDAFKADTMKMINLTGGAANMEAAKKQIIGMIPEAKQAAFIIEFDAMLPALYDKLAAVYMTEYTHDDVKQILKFYDTPIGKKMTAKSGVLTEKSMEASQEWAAGLQPMMMKYMQ